jgi:microcystin-dependent protein
MGLETSTYVNGLNANNPAATDGLAQADDHLRLIKSTIKNTLPNLTGAVTATQDELNVLSGSTVTTADLNDLAGCPTTLADLTASASGLNTAASHYVPSGGIIMWSGAINAIPSGWVLCDGNNSTPNLVDSFVMGAGGGTAVGATGGANDKTLAAANIPAHSHTFSGSTNHTGDHYHLDGEVMDVTAEATFGWDYSTAASRVDQSQSETKSAHARTSVAGAHSHTFSGTTSSYGSGQAFDNRPAYYALAYIMKT